MAALDEVPQNGFGITIKVKERKEKAAWRSEKPADLPAVKYRKSANSLDSRGSELDINVNSVGDPSRAEELSVGSQHSQQEVLSQGEQQVQQEMSLEGEQQATQVGATASKPSCKKSCVTFSEEQVRTIDYCPNEGEYTGAEEANESFHGIQTPEYVRSVLLHDTKDRKFKHRRHSLWYRLRHHHVHMGVVEVNARHPFYLFLKAISCGVADVPVNNSKSGPLENLEDEHYQFVIRREMTLTHGEEGSEKQCHCVFESYAPAVFSTIRRAVGVAEHKYINSISTSQEHAFLEFISNSRSGQDFFLTSDMRYLIKTNKRRDVEFLLSILEDYLQHFLSYPHSLLVKYLGCYSVKLAGHKKLFFLIMQNIFYPANRIEDRFDVKGCTAGRYQEPDPPGSHTITVLKDQNFFQEELQLGPARDWFVDQITADSTFLRNLNVMDYSLLIGRQKLQESELQQNLPDLVSRITKSKLTVPLSASSGSDTMNSSFSMVQPSGEDFLPGTVENTTSDTDALPQQKSGLHFPHSLAEIPDNVCGQRRRLLPNCSNALHIIDGPEYRYFFGIVDFLTQWTVKQKLARLWKIVKYGCGEHSTMPPDYYSQRFVTFLSKRVR